MSSTSNSVRLTVTCGFPALVATSVIPIGSIARFRKLKPLTNKLIENRSRVMLKKTLGLLASAAMILGVSQVASAADMAVKALPPPAPVYTWTGFYIGVNGG